SMLPGINERLLPLTGGQPTAGQIRSRRICHLLAALRQSKSLRGLSSQLQIFFHCFVQTWQ
ncbi:hypothetical protein ET136_20915, partial [Klebsiella pneumoniae]